MDVNVDISFGEEAWADCADVRDFGGRQHDWNLEAECSGEWAKTSSLDILSHCGH